MNESFRSGLSGIIYYRRVGSYGWDSRNLYIPIRKYICARAGINDKYRLVLRNPRFH